MSKIPNIGKLKGYTVFITGASRGIGLAVGKKCAADGANVVIAAKTGKPHPKLEGTIYTAADEIEAAGGKALPLVCDVRDEKSVQNAVAATVAEFGGLDICINNASAISVTDTLNTPMKRYDLMHQVNGRGTFLVPQACLPHLLQSKESGRDPHILNNSPPLDMNAKWFGMCVAYTVAKYNMSMFALGMAEEFKGRVAVNAVWPVIPIWTAATAMLQGEAQKHTMRDVDIMSDCAYSMLCKDTSYTGNFVMDEPYLRKEHGIVDFTSYQCTPSEAKLQQGEDFFVKSVEGMKRHNK